METVKLYGTPGKHRELNVSWEGRNRKIQFEGADFECVCVDYPDGLPRGLAEKLLATNGTWVREWGSEPREAKAKRKREDEIAEITARRDDGPTSDPPATVETGTPETEWPTEELTVKRLREIGRLSGLKSADINELSKGELLVAVQEAVAKQFPALAKAHGFEVEG